MTVSGRSRRAGSRYGTPPPRRRAGRPWSARGRARRPCGGWRARRRGAPDSHTARHRPEPAAAYYRAGERGVAQLGKRACFGSRRSGVQISPPRQRRAGQVACGLDCSLVSHPPSAHIDAALNGVCPFLGLCPAIQRSLDIVEVLSAMRGPHRVQRAVRDVRPHAIRGSMQAIRASVSPANRTAKRSTTGGAASRANPAWRIASSSISFPV